MQVISIDDINECYVVYKNHNIKASLQIAEHELQLENCTRVFLVKLFDLSTIKYLDIINYKEIP